MPSGTISNYFQGARSRYWLIAEWTSTQNQANNTSTVVVNLYARPEGAIYTSSARPGYITINGNKKEFNVSTGNVGAGVKKWLASHTVVVPHSANGVGSSAIAARYETNITYSDRKMNGIGLSGTAGLGTIARYVTVRNLAASNITESTANISWSTDRSVNEVQYRVGNGSWRVMNTATGTSGTGTVTGLPYNANNSVEFSFRAQDSGLWTNKTLNIKTLGPSTITSLFASETTQNDILMSWQATQTITNARYRVDNGSWVNTSLTSRSFRLTGLTANTEYSITLEVTSNNQTTQRTEKITTDNNVLGHLPDTGDTDTHFKPTFTRYNNLVTTEYSILTSTGVTIVPRKSIGTSTSDSVLITEDMRDLIYRQFPNDDIAKLVVRTWSTVNGSSTGERTSSHKNYVISAPLPRGMYIKYEDTDSATLAITEDKRTIVQGHSKILVYVGNIEAGTGATATKTVKASVGTVSGQVVTTTDTATVQLGILGLSGEQTLAIEIVDSRGLVYTENVAINIAPYKAPTIVEFEPTRENSYEEASYLVGLARISSTRANGVPKNGITQAAYRTKLVGTEDWSAPISVTPTIRTNGDYLNVEFNNFMANFNKKKDYDVELTVIDKYGRTATAEAVLRKGLAVISIENGERVRISLPTQAEEGYTQYEEEIVVSQEAEDITLVSDSPEWFTNRVGTKIYKVGRDDTGETYPIQNGVLISTRTGDRTSDYTHDILYNDEGVFTRSYSGTTGEARRAFKQVGYGEKSLLDKVYPVGSLYMTTADIDPEEVIGGKWSRYSTGRVLVGFDPNQPEFNSVGKTGGHKEMQSHGHAFSGTTGGGGAHNHQSRGFYQQRDGNPIAGQRVMANTMVSGDPLDTNSLIAAPNHVHSFSGTTNNTGGGNAGNLQPYIVVNIWRRTS